MIKGIIFDLDGTLINTIADIGGSVNSVLEDYGYPTHTMEEYKKMVGHGFMKLIQSAMPSGLSEEEYEEALVKFTYYYDQLYMDSTHPYDGIIEMLKELQARGIKLGVNSNKRNDYANSLVNTLFKDIEFTKVIGSRKDIPNKPDPTSALEIIEVMNLSKDEVMYIGDGETDIKTGIAAGIKTIGVSWGFKGVEVLKNAGAKTIIDEPCEVLNHLND